MNRDVQFIKEHEPLRISQKTARAIITDLRENKFSTDQKAFIQSCLRTSAQVNRNKTTTNIYG
jgi:fructose-1,6-bisphosphatase